eukprot:3030779-Amphidinium_carterae.2
MEFRASKSDQIGIQEHKAIPKWRGDIVWEGPCPRLGRITCPEAPCCNKQQHTRTIWANTL